MKKRVSKNIVKKSKSISPNKIGLATFIIVTFLTIISLLYIGLIVKPQQYASPTFTNINPLYNPVDEANGQKVFLEWDTGDSRAPGTYVYYGRPASLVEEAARDPSKRNLLTKVSAGFNYETELTILIPVTQGGRGEAIDPASYQYGFFATHYDSRGAESPPTNILTWSPKATYISQTSLVEVAGKKKLTYNINYRQDIAPERFRTYEKKGKYVNGVYQETPWTLVRNIERKISYQTIEDVIGIDSNGYPIRKTVTYVSINEYIPFDTSTVLHLVKAESVSLLGSLDPNSGYGSGYGYGNA
jgi:hypothetical protein